eukprot:3695104-Prymnesium_polylepis.1
MFKFTATGLSSALGLGSARFTPQPPSRQGAARPAGSPRQAHCVLGGPTSAPPSPRSGQQSEASVS